MTVYVDFLHDEASESTDDGVSYTRVYRVKGAESAYAAMTATGTQEDGSSGTIPARGYVHAGSNLVVTDIKAKREFTRKSGSSTQRCYLVSVSYVRKLDRPSDPKDGDELWAWSDRDENEHMEICYSQASYGEKAPTNERLVGCRDDGTIDGVDVLGSAGELTVTKWYDDPDDIASNIVGTWGDMRKTTNDALWKGIFPAGSLLFLGFSIEPTLDDTRPSPVTFRFSYRQNLAVGDLPTFPGMGGEIGSGDEETISITGGKTGHQYMWVLQGSKSDGTLMERRVKGVYVATVYRSSDFDDLGLLATLTVSNAGDGS